MEISSHKLQRTAHAHCLGVHRARCHLENPPFRDVVVNPPFRDQAAVARHNGSGDVICPHWIDFKQNHCCPVGDVRAKQQGANRCVREADMSRKPLVIKRWLPDAEAALQDAFKPFERRPVIQDAWYLPAINSAVKTHFLNG